MLIPNPTADKWVEFEQNCLSTPQDMQHLNKYPYANIRPEAPALLAWLRDKVQDKVNEAWLIEENETIVGFFIFGSYIPGQPDGFGMGIGSRFTRQGYAGKALREFLANRQQDVNGYCNRNNVAIIRLMESLGFTNDPAFNDRRDPNAVKYSWIVK